MMKFEDALPLLRKGATMVRDGDPKKINIKLVEVDGTLSFIARVNGHPQPIFFNIGPQDVLAEDWIEVTEEAATAAPA